MVSKTQLVDHLCEWGEEVSTNAIEVYVHRLRKKLEPSGVKIITVRGLGYRAGPGCLVSRQLKRLRANR
ncbi:two-component system response regulator [Bordetella pertussis]|nr:two-component system response regulator [Bordetella pertussis]